MGVHSALLCKQTQQLLPMKKEPMTSTPAVEPLQILAAFAPQVFAFAHANYLGPSLPLPEPGNHNGSHPRPLRMHKCKMPSSTPLWLTTIVHALGAGSSSCALHAASLTLVISLHCVYTLKGRLYSHRRARLTAKAPPAACGPKLGTGFCHWPAPLCLPEASPSSCAPAYPSLDPHFQLPLHSWQDSAGTVVCAESHSTHSWPQPLLPALALTTTCVSATGPCHYTAPAAAPHS